MMPLLKDSKKKSSTSDTCCLGSSSAWGGGHVRSSFPVDCRTRESRRQMFISVNVHQVISELDVPIHTYWMRRQSSSEKFGHTYSFI